ALREGLLTFTLQFAETQGCCILNDDTYDKIYKNFIWLLIFFIGNECIFLILKFILKKRIKRNDNSSMQRMNEEKEISIRFAGQETEKKQEIILKSHKNMQDSNLPVDDVAQTVMKYDIDFHEDFIWCLENLSGTCIANHILLLHINENQEYEFVAETMRQRQLGLPKPYYIIAKTDNNYLCGRADVGRVYCFSHALGITNTPYATIYDYIIEQSDT
ncbi:MAG: SMI1/KNR4 family protein, partial [Clostridium sp.]|nr:SMI1/KNR4 family protein [Clostridium sp.]